MRNKTNLIIISIFVLPVLYVLLLASFEKIPMISNSNIMTLSFEDESIKDDRIVLGSGANNCYSFPDRCEEKWFYFAKGFYYNCSIRTEDLDEGYKNFSMIGKINNIPNYKMSMNDLFIISNTTRKPIICDMGEHSDYKTEIEYLKVSLSRKTRLYNVMNNSEISGNSYIDGSNGKLCNGEYDARMSNYKIYCCVDEYCSVYDDHVEERIHCQCDDSLNVTSDIQYICSNIKEGLPKCYEE